jgi:hypothetical protein
VTAAQVLAPFIGALDLTRLRLGPPRRFIFFCGGKIDHSRSSPLSLRDYLSREISGAKSINDAPFVYAESATRLYLDTNYSDLIAFEADIAQISDIVLIIGESAGSLTELGAFSMNAATAPRLKIITQGKYDSDESFIRNGPIRHMEKLWPDSVSSYDWRTKSTDNTIIKSSAAPHVASIRQELIERLAKFAAKEKFDAKSKRHVMILIFLIVQRLRGAKPKEIADSLVSFGVSETPDSIRNLLYCMRVADWIGEKKYGNPIFYYPKVNRDPFEYAFVAATNDPLRFKSDVATQMKRPDISRPKTVISLAAG